MGREMLSFPDTDLKNEFSPPNIFQRAPMVLKLLICSVDSVCYLQTFMSLDIF